VETAVEVRGLGHTFPGNPPVPALREVDLVAAEGEFVSIVGPSGCGKSTILRALAGLIKPDTGVARIDDQDVTARPGVAAYMPQGGVLLPWLRALSNATLGATVLGTSKREATDRARALFQRFGLDGFERAWPSELSGGMQQRVALLRTFLTPRGTILLDEPFGALDAITRREMHAWLQEVWLAERRTALFVTHDVDEALTLSDRVYVMSKRPGTMVAELRSPFDRPRARAAQTSVQFSELKAQLLDALESASS
jgi:ABC-type nitrate/sulfonate/bicarbonate transport system ATPase subunit